MKILNIISLVLFFLIICSIILKNFLLIEKYTNNITDNREECSEHNNADNNASNKSDNNITNKDTDNKNTDNKKKSNSDNNNDDNKITFKNLIEHPAKETNKELSKQFIKPININITCNTDKEQNNFDTDVIINDRIKSKKCDPYNGDYITGTVSNQFITTGYGAQSSLGSGPVKLIFTDQYTVPENYNKKTPMYKKYSTAFGSADNAKLPKNIFITEDDSSYTIVNDKYISFPQERYSVSELYKKE